MNKLIAQVRTRLLVADLARRFHLFFLGLAGAYLAALLAARLTKLIPDVFTGPTLAIPAGAALLLALAFHRRPSLDDSARRIDERAATKDLYLTALHLDHTAGEYQPLVLRQAEERSATIKPVSVAPWNWLPGARKASGALATAALAIAFLPSFDPFEKQVERDKLAQKKKQLEQMAKLTEKRLAEVRKAEPKAEQSPQVEALLQQLQQELRTMKPEDKEGNRERLVDQQKAVGAEWRKAAENKLRNALNESSVEQRFGGGEAKERREWKEGMAQGQPEELRAALDKLRKKLKELAKTGAGDKAMREELRKQMLDKLDQLKEFASRDFASPEMSDALRRAYEQLDLARFDELDQEALDGLDQSLQLTQEEMERLAQQLRDLKAMQQALRALQMARRLNEAKGLDGKDGESCKGVGDYEKLYAQMMAEFGMGQGEGEGIASGKGQGKGQGKGNGGKGQGMGGKGQGQGGLAGYDPNEKDQFVPEKSKSAVKAGKTIMQWKVRELAERGEAALDYQAAIDDLKQGLSEAILHEEVPPGYHEAIQKYFDDIEQVVEEGEGD